MRINNLLLAFLLVSSSIFASISDKEKQALIAFNQSTNGQNWTTKWNLNQPVETWYGVTIKNNKVVSISLVSNNLEGKIDGSIKDLMYLETFNVFKNKLNGEVPSEIFNLTNLKNLNLSFNSFSGKLPSNVGNAKSLISLEIFMNQLSGQLPESIGELQNLELLSLFNNSLTGELPQGLFRLNNLKELLLNSNSLSGELNANVANLTKLENLSLFDNKLSGTIPSLEKLTKLNALNLSLNNFRDFEDSSLVSLDRFKLQMYKGNSKEKVQLGEKATPIIVANKSIKENPVTLSIKE
ncbi:Two component regulator three Y domain protein [Flavobacterium ponti]|jgi:Leucine-rich repeat (LRR) protein|uniref:Two component regulator three Y domain protein n=1 Tax=Flavobacterium ponti TaxID=665133 RepID=A0ABV9P4G2_9FLAO